jgi:hypothetical protein
VSQKAFLADLDESLHAAFSATGLADSGVYTPPGAAQDFVPLACQIYVDRDVQTLGDTRQFKAGRVEVVYVLGSLLIGPTQHGKLAVDGDTYINDVEISNDGSLSRWQVRRG